jgi:hypothetical protein
MPGPPHEQMAAKTKRSSRLVERNLVLKRQMSEEQKAEEEALRKADEHAAKEAQLLAEYETNCKEIERLALETHNIIEQKFDAAGDTLEGMFDKACAGMLKQFDDPLLAHDTSVAENRPEMEQMQQTFGDIFRKMAEVSRVLAEAQKSAAEAASIRAKETAKDAAEAATTERKANAAPGAAPPPQPASSSQSQPIPAVSRVSVRLGASARGMGAWNKPLAIALEKPVHERSGDEVVAAARASKIARTRTLDEQMDEELALM